LPGLPLLPTINSAAYAGATNNAPAAMAAAMTVVNLGFMTNTSMVVADGARCKNLRATRLVHRL